MNDDLAREMITELKRIADALEQMVPEPGHTEIVPDEDLHPELYNDRISYD